MGDEEPADLRRIARWMRSGIPGTTRIATARFDIDLLLKHLGGSPTFKFPVIRVDGRAYTFEPNGKHEVLIHYHPEV